MTGRRFLLAGNWKPVLVTDSVIVVIGFLLAVLALTCWVRQRRAGKKDAAVGLPVFTPSNPVINRLVTGGDQNPSPISGSPRSGSDLPITEPGRWPPVGDSSGRWSQVEEGLGSWERANAGDGYATKREGKEETLGRWKRVGEEGRARGLEIDDQRPGNTPGLAENLPGTGVRILEGGPGRWSLVTGEEWSPIGSPDGDGDKTTVTAQGLWQTAKYGLEPFCFHGLAAATGNFDESNKLGAGAFGTVYRGLLFDGRVVAIKRADRDNMVKMLDKQCSFKAELDVMSRLHHKHLVNLVGYCDDCDEMMLVYEYMPNGTLADHLHNKRFKSRALASWKARIRMALQAARGIEYLHTYAEPPVIHRDIKSSNLLLDAKGSVRVSDFGLCFIFPTASDDEGEELVNTDAAGTMGYMDPEYYCHRQLTTKSDVYSFGVVILELLTGKKAIYRRNNTHVSVVDYAVPAIDSGELASIVDPRLRAPTAHEFAAMKVMAEVGSQAVRLRGKDRPGMTDIVRRLEQAVTFFRPRHAPIPVFGAQIGSSTDPSDYCSSQPSPPSCLSEDRLSEDPPLPGSHLDPTAAEMLDKFVTGGMEEQPEEEDAEGKSGTDVAQLGSEDVARVGSPSTSRASLLVTKFLRHITHNILKTHDDIDDDDDDDSFGQHKSDDINLERYPNVGLLSSPLRRSSGWPSARGMTASAADSNHAIMEMGSSSLSSAAAAQADFYHNGGQSDNSRRSSEEHRETLVQELRQSWWRSPLSQSKRVKFGGSFYSCERNSAAASTTDVHSDYCSGKNVDDSSLHQCTAVSAESSHGDHSNGDRQPLEDVQPPPTPPRDREPNHGLPTPAVAGQDEQGREFEEFEENQTGDIDIESFRYEYWSEEGKSTSYVGFSNFSVPDGLDSLMKALHSLQDQR
ncbi:unnamed protein product [Calypogeia fissa]